MLIQTCLMVFVFLFVGRAEKNKLNEDKNQNVEQCQKKINTTYSNLLELAQVNVFDILDLKPTLHYRNKLMSVIIIITVFPSKALSILACSFLLLYLFFIITSSYY